MNCARNSPSLPTPADETRIPVGFGGEPQEGLASGGRGNLPLDESLPGHPDPQVQQADIYLALLHFVASSVPAVVVSYSDRLWLVPFPVEDFRAGPGWQSRPVEVLSTKE